MYLKIYIKENKGWSPLHTVHITTKSWWIQKQTKKHAKLQVMNFNQHKNGRIQQSKLKHWILWFPKHPSRFQNNNLWNDNCSITYSHAKNDSAKIYATAKKKTTKN